MTTVCAPSQNAIGSLSAGEIRKLLSPFRRPVWWTALWQLLSTLGAFVALIVLMRLGLEISYLLVVLLALPAAGLLVRLFIFQHDCGHGSFFPAQRANHLVGSLLGLLTFTPYYDWRHDHALHHASNGDLDRRGDGDVMTLTVDEYRRLGWWGRLGYRLYRHPLVLFGVFPTLLFAVRFRTALFTPRDRKKERLSIRLTNLGLAAWLVGLGAWMGWLEMLMIFGPVWVIAATLGVWMFYVQHQFDPTYWKRSAQWDRVHASLRGSSYYRLPKLLQWFTGNIGLHHIHHLDSRIPNYRLQACLDSHPELLDIPALTLRSSLRCPRLKLWDERTERLVGFDAARTSKS